MSLLLHNRVGRANNLSPLMDQTPSLREAVHKGSDTYAKSLRLHGVRLPFHMASIGISIDPAVCHGKPVIEGTRVLVSTVLGALAGGDSREVVAEDYSLTLDEISAALQFASDIANFQGSAYESVA